VAVYNQVYVVYYHLTLNLFEGVMVTMLVMHQTMWRVPKEYYLKTKTKGTKEGSVLDHTLLKV
jgi:hypothetical protein